ncbi:MAG: hypothetical protein Q609_ECAC01529G0003 [Escherichia coli DORA_A_5_14_21]|uniref:Uncharacterized protein n=2 Tax=root TaxID=1 RepID=W1X1Y6_ECOLX|nr:MAG: hypothetical protein Q609_ECAC01529G0003 [Escherichia coli DORA_A_5_14_21]
MHVEDLAQRVGHETGGGDTGDKQVEVSECAESLPGAHIEQRRDDVGDQQRRDHHRKDDTTGQRCAKNTHGQVGSKENKRKAKRAPGGMETKNGDGKLNQIVTGGDHQKMK